MRPKLGRSFVIDDEHSTQMFKRTRQELRNFASDERADGRFIELAVDSAHQVRGHSAVMVAAVISRLDEIVAEGLGKSIWRTDEAPAFSI
jgi:hypothetical protein